MVCICTVSPQERGRELGRRPERTNIVSSHRDPLHVCESALSCDTRRKFNVMFEQIVLLPPPSVTLCSASGALTPLESAALDKKDADCTVTRRQASLTLCLFCP